jgi:biotin carboxyl carrier protein
VVLVNGEPFRVELRETPEGPQAGAVPPAGRVPAAGPVPQARPAPPAPAPAAATPGPLVPGDEAVVAPMPGMIVEVQKRPGDPVKAGESVLIMEAMKMNNNIESHCDGTVKELRCGQGDSVAKGQVLFVVTRPPR